MDKEAIEEAIEVLEDASAEMLAETGDENYYAEAIAILRQALSGEAVKHIKTWNERCEEHPDHQERIISERMIQERMQEEIDELRQALIMFQHSTKIVPMTQPAQQQEPVISTDHGPWIPSTHPREEGETYCKRCLLRDKFFGSRQCDPHIVYTAPPKKEWVGLTDEERHSIREWRGIQKELGPVWAPMLLYLYEAIEAKLKEKNT